MDSDYKYTTIKWIVDSW